MLTVLLLYTKVTVSDVKISTVAPNYLDRKATMTSCSRYLVDGNSNVTNFVSTAEYGSGSNYIPSANYTNIDNK